MRKSCPSLEFLAAPRLRMGAFMLVLTEFNKQKLLFRDPVKTISCFHTFDVLPAFEEMEEALRRGYYLAGYMSYEAGYAFEKRLEHKEGFDFPLLQFGVYEKPIRENWVRGKGYEVKEGTNAELKIHGPNISKRDYSFNIEKIRDHIAAGDVYQITYCIKHKFKTSGDHFKLYRKLQKIQPVPYPAYIEMGQHTILSLSPEMFIYKSGENIITKPMKGTWPRGGSFWEDIWSARKLHKDPKNRAENIMIADLLRNDLGRIGHSVKWPKLFEVARYKTLCQMTSTVTAKVKRDIPLYDLFSSLHPSGSVTGTPKIRAMEIIREIEKEERRIYTGAIGYITPEKDMFFNVPIRTLLIRKGEGQEQGRGQGEMGVGGGIVWDSTAEGEWEEGRLKARFLTELTP